MLAAKIIGDLGSISVGLIYVFFAVGRLHLQSLSPYNYLF